MAGKKFRITNTAIALVAAVAKTLIQVLAGANNKTVIPHIEISFDGAAADGPALVTVLRQTTAPGTPGTAPTVVEMPNGDVGTLQVAASTGGGTEPTASDVYWRNYLTPSGRHVIPGPFEIVGADRLGVTVTAQVGVNAGCTIPGEE